MAFVFFANETGRMRGEEGERKAKGAEEQQEGREAVRHISRREE